MCARRRARGVCSAASTVAESTERGGRLWRVVVVVPWPHQLAPAAVALGAATRWAPCVPIVSALANAWPACRRCVAGGGR